MNWYIKVLKNYIVFGGRARRKEYWFFFLFNALAAITLGILDGILWGGELLYLTGNYADFNWEASYSYEQEILSNIYWLAILLPSTAVAIRRLHDTNHSAWWLLLFFIPIVGWLVLFIFMVTNGDPGKNSFGPDPKKEADPTSFLNKSPSSAAPKQKGASTRKATSTRKPRTSRKATSSTAKPATTRKKRTKPSS